jgi:hypothetical protein
MYKPIKENLKRLALPPWDGLDDNVKISLLLGIPPPPIRQAKGHAGPMALVYSKLLFLNSAQTLVNTFLHITDHGIPLINHRRQPKPQVELSHYTPSQNLPLVN